MIQSFVPMLVLISLAVVKIVMFKIRDISISIAILLSLLVMVFAFESHFDIEKFNVPLFVVAIPFAVILLATTL